jgi:hypothetical protein
VTITADAIYNGHALLPQEHLELVRDQHYAITIDVPAQNAAVTDDAWAILERLSGAVDGPQDWSEQHDHSIYGTPKK